MIWYFYQVKMSLPSLTSKMLPHNQAICGGPEVFGTNTCAIKEGSLEMTLCNCRADPDSNLNKIEAYIASQNRDNSTSERPISFRGNHLLNSLILTNIENSMDSYDAKKRQNFYDAVAKDVNENLVTYGSNFQTWQSKSVGPKMVILEKQLHEFKAMIESNVTEGSDTVNVYDSPLLPPILSCYAAVRQKNIDAIKQSDKGKKVAGKFCPFSLILSQICLALDFRYGIKYSRLASTRLKWLSTYQFINALKPRLH